ncbi:MAG: response regulator transcription factor [Acidobacteriia bacterium]|nr:response regulator transcription factor [Terriglobia bacterium]
MPEVASPGIRLLVVDDHAMFREAVAEKLGKEPDMTVVGTCGSAAEALELLRSGSRPTMILLDFDLGPERVIDFLHEVRATGFAGQVLVVTAGVSGREGVQLIQAGIHGILHKHNTPKTLCETIRQIARGEVFLEKAYLGTVFHDLNQTRAPEEPHLTERDKAILRLVFQGLANKEIAARLQISEGAVKSSISQLFHKLSVRTRAQLVKVALEQYSDQL